MNNNVYQKNEVTDLCYADDDEEEDNEGIINIKK